MSVKVTRNMLREFYGIPTTTQGVTTWTYYYMNPGFIKLEEQGGAELDDTAYIGDKNGSPSVTGYKNAFAFEAHYLKGDTVLDDIRDIVVNQKTGSDCERKIVSIDMSETPATAGTYTAREIKIAVEATPPAGEPKSITKMTGNMHQIGDIVAGTFVLETKVFTAAA